MSIYYFEVTNNNNFIELTPKHKGAGEKQESSGIKIDFGNKNVEDLNKDYIDNWIYGINKRKENNDQYNINPTNKIKQQEIDKILEKFRQIKDTKTPEAKNENDRPSSSIPSTPNSTKPDNTPNINNSNGTNTTPSQNHYAVDNSNRSSKKEGSMSSWDEINNMASKRAWVETDRNELKAGRAARRKVWNRNKQISKPKLNSRKNNNTTTMRSINNYLKSLGCKYDDVKANEFAENMYQGSMGTKSYGYCFAFVKMGLEESYDDIGYIEGVSAGDAAGIFPHDKNIRKHFTKLPDDLVKTLNFNDLPAGCIIIYKTGNNIHKSQHGHIEVALGNGNVCSDFIKSEHTNQKPKTTEDWENIEIYVPTMPA